MDEPETEKPTTKTAERASARGVGRSCNVARAWHRARVLPAWMATAYRRSCKKLWSHAVHATEKRRAARRMHQKLWQMLWVNLPSASKAGMSLLCSDSTRTALAEECARVIFVPYPVVPKGRRAHHGGICWSLDFGVEDSWLQGGATISCKPARCKKSKMSDWLLLLHLRQLLHPACMVRILCGPTQRPCVSGCGKGQRRVQIALQ